MSFIPTLRTLRSVKYKASEVLEHVVSLQRVQRDLEGFILIGAHHKTGSEWMKAIFWKLSMLYGYIFCANTPGATIPDHFCILFDNHSRFDLASLDKRPYRGLHLIRDPRDVIISGCYYHQKSGEPWLHVKREEYGGMTYQEKLLSFSSMRDRLLFEMEGAAARTITDMYHWNYQNPSFFEVKYEDLIVDYDLLLFHQIFSFLGFGGELIPKTLDLAWKNSLFSNRLAPNLHRRSGQPSQWRQHFEPCHKQRFDELFDDVLVKLGYERDNTWADV
jgi:hypothetical protein